MQNETAELWIRHTPDEGWQGRGVDAGGFKGGGDESGECERGWDDRPAYKSVDRSATGPPE